MSVPESTVSMPRSVTTGAVLDVRHRTENFVNASWILVDLRDLIFDMLSLLFTELEGQHGMVGDADAGCAFATVYKAAVKIVFESSRHAHLAMAGGASGLLKNAENYLKQTQAASHSRTASSSGSLLRRRCGHRDIRPRLRADGRRPSRPGPVGRLPAPGSVAGAGGQWQAVAPHKEEQARQAVVPFSSMSSVLPGPVPLVPSCVGSMVRRASVVLVVRRRVRLVDDPVFAALGGDRAEPGAVR